VINLFPPSSLSLTFSLLLFLASSICSCLPVYCIELQQSVRSMQFFIFSSHSLSMASICNIIPFDFFFFIHKKSKKVDLITIHANYGRRVLKCKDEPARILQQYYRVAGNIYRERIFMNVYVRTYIKVTSIYLSIFRHFIALQIHN